MISRVSPSARAGVALADRFGDLDVQGDGGRVGVLEHHLVMGAAGQHLRDDVAEPGEHLVARRVEDHPVEGDVVDQVVLQAGGRARWRPCPARSSVRSAHCSGVACVAARPGGDRLDRRAQDGERAQLVRTVGAGQPPADDLRVVDVPLGLGAHRHADAAAGLDEVHGLQHADRLAHHGAGDVEALGQFVGAQDAARRVLARGDGGAEGVQYSAVQTPARSGHAHQRTGQITTTKKSDLFITAS